jgi:hypothetical protein
LLTSALQQSAGTVDERVSSIVELFSVLKTQEHFFVDKRGLLDHIAVLDRESALLLTSDAPINLNVVVGGSEVADAAVGPVVLVEIPKPKVSPEMEEQFNKSVTRSKIGVIFTGKDGVRRLAEVRKIVTSAKLDVDLLPLVDFYHYMVPYALVYII